MRGAEPAPLHVSVEDGLAIIELSNPPVNALFGRVRDQIAALAPRLDADPAVHAILFVAAGPAFCAGVDLKKTADRTEPFFLHAALDAMDEVSKPLCAAIHGVALGGGLELALSCHYRMGGPKARFGLPEVEVGLIPGACGTQRLPRLVPLDAALGVAGLGDILDVADAQRLGLIDASANEDPFRPQAVAWARSLFGAPIRRTRDLPVKSPDLADRAFAEAARRAAEERPGEAAPLVAIAAVRAACELTFDEGVEEERRLVSACKASAEARAMRHLFFAERAAGRADAAAVPLPALRIQGSQAGRLAMLLDRGDAGTLVYAVDPREAAPADAITVCLPIRPSGVVGLDVPAGTDEALVAALAKRLRGAGRATVIGRGARLAARLASVLDANPDHPAKALANEADRLVAAGHARALGEIDLICVGLLGLARSSGGPTYMRSIGEA